MLDKIKSFFKMLGSLFSSRQVAPPQQPVKEIPKSSEPIQPPTAPPHSSGVTPQTTYEDLPWIQIAHAEIGVAEVPGPGSNPRIVEYSKAADGIAEPDDVPWCSSFMNWVWKKVGLKGTGSKYARSWLKWGVGLDQFYPGCIVVFWRGDRNGELGHVTFGMKQSPAGTLCLGGNQSDQVKYSWEDTSRILAFRWPKEYPLPEGAKVIP